MAQTSVLVKATRPSLWLEVNIFKTVTEHLLREKGKDKAKKSVEENEVLKTCLLACYFSYPVKK